MVNSIVTDAQKKQMKKLYRAGHTYKEIAAQLDLKLWHVAYALKKARTEKPAKVKRTPRIPQHELTVAGVPTAEREHARPLIAFVGSPAEVTHSIKELFS